MVSRLTEYFTGTHYGPVKEIAESARTGPATVVLSGTAYGLESSVYAILCIAVALGATIAFSFTVTWVLAKVLDKTIGLRVSTEDELVGLDQSQHAETAYQA